MVASLLLALVRVPVLQYALVVSDDVLAEAQAYWWLRCGLVPCQLLNMSLSGILQVWGGGGIGAGGGGGGFSEVRGRLG